MKVRLYRNPEFRSRLPVGTKVKEDGSPHLKGFPSTRVEGTPPHVPKVAQHVTSPAATIKQNVFIKCLLHCTWAGCLPNSQSVQPERTSTSEAIELKTQSRPDSREKGRSGKG